VVAENSSEILIYVVALAALRRILSRVRRLIR